MPSQQLEDGAPTGVTEQTQAKLSVSGHARLVYAYQYPGGGVSRGDYRHEILYVREDLSARVPASNRRNATPAQMISTTPNGQAPARNPYALESRHPTAKARTNARCCLSAAYVAIMKVTAITPNTVTPIPLILATS